MANNELKSIIDSNPHYIWKKSNSVKMEISQQAGLLRHRRVTKVVNKVGIIGKVIALSIKFLAFKAYDVTRIPKNLRELAGRIRVQLDRDIGDLAPEKRDTLRAEVEEMIREEGIHIPEGERETYIEAALASYSTSQKYYGKMAREWAIHLMDTAAAENRKLVFLARDGLAPMKMAEKLKERYPERYENVDISYLYFSRKVVGKWSDREEKVVGGVPSHQLKSYVEANGIKEEDKVLFVDVGFSGSVIKPVKSKLADLSLDAEFEFLISMSENARGFLADLQHPNTVIEPPNGASGNPASHWLEDTHQGVINSAEKLVQQDQEYIPDCLANGEAQTCKDEHPLSYLVKQFGLKGVEDAFNEDALDYEEVSLDETPVAWKPISERTEQVFTRFLEDLRNGDQLLLAEHF